MLLSVILGCVAHVAPVPVTAEHIGSEAEPHRKPMVPVWVEAQEQDCRHLAEALRFVLEEHGRLLLLPKAKTQIRITHCATLLDEQITINPRRTAELEGQDALDVVLTGRASIHLEFWREQFLLDEASYDIIRVDRQEWIGGERYPWREELTGLTERDLVESVEVALMAPHPALQAPLVTPPN